MRSEFPVLSAHANEGPKSISSPTHGLTGQKASADDQHKTNESGRLLDKTPSRLPPQEFPVLSAHANEGPKSILSPTHGLTSQKASQKASADDQHKSNEGSQKNVGSNTGGKECCIRATPQ